MYKLPGASNTTHSIYMFCWKKGGLFNVHDDDKKSTKQVYHFWPNML